MSFCNSIQINTIIKLWQQKRSQFSEIFSKNESKNEHLQKVVFSRSNFHFSNNFKTNNESTNVSYNSSFFSCIFWSSKQGLIPEIERKTTLALGIASISSRKRSLIACTWSSIAFNDASTAVRSVMLLAGYTAKRKNGRFSSAENWICMKSKTQWNLGFSVTHCFGRWRVLEAP